MDNEWWWLLVGFGAQGLFMLRFVIQWLHSERQRKSVIPLSFWYFSIAGALLLLAYSVHRRDPLFIAGQLVGVAAYVRNLFLIRGERAAARRAPAPDA
jgi:lipid-A-disaccharide synthase-like uncharacterized protein